ncbi:ABATE domain-containing protein, partial [Kocuria palustris]|uniref:ABATE domain-containing protein n=1 Tax=Kocuria palustris TaxID=71999 RepID=UPI003D74E395
MTTYGTSAWLDSSDGRRWRFDPGSLSLAFAYTGDFGYGVPAWEQLHSSIDLDVWLAERFGTLLYRCKEAEFTGAHELRMAISASARRAAAGDVLDPTDVDTINVWAARLPISPHLEGGTRPAEVIRPAQALATIARDATTTFTHAPGRIRE